MYKSTPGDNTRERVWQFLEKERIVPSLIVNAKACVLCEHEIGKKNKKMAILDFEKRV